MDLPQVVACGKTVYHVSAPRHGDSLIVYECEVLGTVTSGEEISLKPLAEWHYVGERFERRSPKSNQVMKQKSEVEPSLQDQWKSISDKILKALESLG